MENSNKEVFRERERKRERGATSVNHRQPALPFRGRAAGLCTESTVSLWFTLLSEVVIFALAGMSGCSRPGTECGASIKASA